MKICVSILSINKLTINLNFGFYHLSIENFSFPTFALSMTCVSILLLITFVISLVDLLTWTCF